MIIAGVDPSLTQTGVAIAATGAPDSLVLRRFGTKPADGPLLARMRYLVAEVFAATEHADLVVIEGLSYGSKGSATRDLAGLWWMLVDCLSRRVRLYPHRTVAVVDPSTLKLWAAGHGQADKRQVREAISAAWGRSSAISTDEADALALMSMGLHHVGALPWPPTDAQRRAIQTPTWDLEAA